MTDRRAFCIIKIVMRPIILFGFLVPFAMLSSCENYNPSFADTVPFGTDPEHKKGYFVWTITYPKTYGIERDSRFTLVLKDLEGLSDNTDVLQYEPGSGWLMRNARIFTRGADGEEYVRIDNSDEPLKIFYGYYKATICIGNPLSYVIKETYLWLSPGRTAGVVFNFDVADFQ